jgi:hypothetical protein
VARRVEKSADRVLVGRPEGERILERPRLDESVILKMDLQQI